ncbi:MAG: mechanosensitive ion channel family protein [Bacteroidales bacterium]
MDWMYLKYIILIAGTILLATILSVLIRKLVTIFINRKISIIRGDPTNFSFLKNAIPFVIFTIAIIFIFIKIPFLKSLGTALFAGAGILAAIIGFASQKAFANIISGFFILVFRPFRVGDIIEVTGARRGTVEEITLRHTVIRDFENRRIIIPNSQMSDEVIINSTISDESIRKFVDFSISYGSDVDLAMTIIREEAENHPNFIDMRTDQEKEDKVPAVMVRMIGLGDFSVNLRAYVWSANNAAAFELNCDLLKSVKKRFDNEGIEIPFPYRTIVFKDGKEKLPPQK